MTKIDERISLELELDLMALFEEDTACEIENHDERSEIHDGHAEWYLISGPCVHCGELDDDAVMAVCDPFKVFVEATLYTSTVPCGECGKRMPTSDFLLKIEPKKGR